MEKQVRSGILRFGQVAKLAKNAGTLPQNALATKDYAKQAHKHRSDQTHCPYSIVICYC
ncbi:hypothetical protein J2Z48_000511 [Croceifilum oryzae]|uniref:Uncharacterized protein n=1 Tax=Croceifilum oryzae TaxID=1553429 RepID=A0AAJ1TG07_9BACL|nr:hypothetical protein [Croceifilum oryzae]MDQ0416347.1 hypothetical protein [Croceifilum oryzae]